MNRGYKTSYKIGSMGRGNWDLALLRDGFLLGTLLAATGVAEAQSTGATAAPVDDRLTFHGITLYGTVDIGLQSQTHGAPISDYYPAQAAQTSFSQTAITQ